MKELQEQSRYWEISRAINSFNDPNSLEASTLESLKQELDIEASRLYLQKYLLTSDEYRSTWNPIQSQIFINQHLALPKLSFKPTFKTFILRGGSIFVQSDFESLQACMKEMRNKYFVVVENIWRKFRADNPEPPLRMKYPVDITWEELMSGNVISATLFLVSWREYFVFSESPTWGKYADNDDTNLGLVGFLPEHERIFKKHFEYFKEEEDEIKHWRFFPLEYANVEVRKGSACGDKESRAQVSSISS